MGTRATGRGSVAKMLLALAAGAQHAHNSPVKSPNADTASTGAFNIAQAGGAGVPARRSFLNPTTEGDQRHLYGQGKPMGKGRGNREEGRAERFKT
jgi:hypothetical protein